MVKDLPGCYIEYRERLLKLAYKFSKLDAETKEKYVDASSRYRFALCLLDSSALYVLYILVLGGPMARYGSL